MGIDMPTQASGPSCFGNWAPPPQCVHSFTYQGKAHVGCKVDNDQGWCSHDSTYSGGWSRCQPCYPSMPSCTDSTTCAATCPPEMFQAGLCTVMCDIEYWRCICQGG